MPSATHHRFTVWPRGSLSLQAWSPRSAGSRVCPGADVTTLATLQAPDRGSSAVWGQVCEPGCWTCSEQREGWASYRGGVHAGVGALSSTLSGSPCSEPWLCQNLRCPQSSQRTVQGETAPVEPQETSTRACAGLVPKGRRCCSGSLAGRPAHWLGRSARHPPPHPTAARSRGRADQAWHCAVPSAFEPLLRTVGGVLQEERS